MQVLLFADWQRTTKQFFKSKMSARAIQDIEGEIAQRLFRIDCDRFWAAMGEHNVGEYELRSDPTDRRDKGAREIAKDVLQEFITGYTMCRSPKPASSFSLPYDQLLSEWKKYHGVLSDFHKDDEDSAPSPTTTPKGKKQTAKPKPSAPKATAKSLPKTSPAPLDPSPAKHKRKHVPTAQQPDPKRRKTQPAELVIATQGKPKRSSGTKQVEVPRSLEISDDSQPEPDPVAFRGPVESRKSTDILVARLMTQLSEQEQRAKDKDHERQEEIKELTRLHASAASSVAQLTGRVAELQTLLEQEKQRSDAANSRVKELGESLEQAQRQCADRLEQQTAKHVREQAELRVLLSSEIDGLQQQIAASRAALEQGSARHDEAQKSLAATNAALATELEEAKRRIIQLEATAAQGEFAKLVAFMEPQFSAIQAELRATNARQFDLMRDFATRAVAQPTWPAVMQMPRSWPDSQAEMRPSYMYRPHEEEGRRGPGAPQTPPNQENK